MAILRYRCGCVVINGRACLLCDDAKGLMRTITEGREAEEQFSEHTSDPGVGDRFQIRPDELRA